MYARNDLPNKLWNVLSFANTQYNHNSESVCSIGRKIRILRILRTCYKLEVKGATVKQKLVKKNGKKKFNKQNLGQQSL